MSLLVNALFSIALGMAQAPTQDFEAVQQILRKSCAECHAFGVTQGGFSLESRQSMLEHGEAVIPGNAKRSLLIALVSGTDTAGRVMPMQGPRLEREEITTLSAWIDAGAPWPENFLLATNDEHTSDVPSIFPRRPALPPATAEVSHPVDRILGDYSRTKDITLSPIVDDAAFLRRTSLDLRGLLPDLEELEQFLASRDQDKREQWVSSLLGETPKARADYSAHWMTFWNDLLRNDYRGTGYIDGGRQQISNWLWSSLLENKPYNQFVVELVDPMPDSEGFANGIVWRGQASASQATELQYARNVSQVFLGANVKCASCHDSFVNRFKLADTYGLAAITADEPLELHRCDKPTGETAIAKFLFPEIGDIDPSAPREERLKRFAELVTSPDNGRFTRTIVNRLWKQLMGRGLIEPIDDMEQQPWSRDLLDYLATDLADHGYDLKHTLRQITTSQAYQRVTVASDSEETQKAFVFRGPAPRRLTAEQFLDALWSLSGERPETHEGEFAEDAAGLDQPVRAALVNSTPLMRTLGRPNREQTVSSRPTELVTLQALELTNGEEVSSHLSAAAKRFAEAGLSARALVDRLFRHCLSRPPSEAERSAALEMLSLDPSPAAIEDLLWALLMHPEFQLVGGGW